MQTVLVSSKQISQDLPMHLAHWHSAPCVERRILRPLLYASSHCGDQGSWWKAHHLSWCYTSQSSARLNNLLMRSLSWLNWVDNCGWRIRRKTEEYNRVVLSWESIKYCSWGAACFLLVAWTTFGQVMLAHHMVMMTHVSYLSSEKTSIPRVCKTSIGATTILLKFQAIIGFFVFAVRNNWAIWGFRSGWLPACIQPKTRVKTEEPDLGRWSFLFGNMCCWFCWANRQVEWVRGLLCLHLNRSSLCQEPRWNIC